MKKDDEISTLADVKVAFRNKYEDTSERFAEIQEHMTDEVKRANKVLYRSKQNGENQTFVLRKIYLWNKTSNRRTCCLAWDSGRAMSTVECAQAILNRWGASENTFKHIYDRNPARINATLKRPTVNQQHF